MNREETLKQASKIVNGDREEQYGSPENNFDIIARLWSTYLGSVVSCEDVANMMILLKIARTKSGQYSSDNYIDICGYAACANELQAKSPKPSCTVDWTKLEPKKTESIVVNWGEMGRSISSSMKLQKYKTFYEASAVFNKIDEWIKIHHNISINKYFEFTNMSEFIRKENDDYVWRSTSDFVIDQYCNSDGYVIRPIVGAQQRSMVSRDA